MTHLEHLLHTPGVDSVLLETQPQQKFETQNEMTIVIGSIALTVWYHFAAEGSDESEPKPISCWGDSIEQAAMYGLDAIEMIESDALDEEEGEEEL